MPILKFDRLPPEIQKDYGPKEREKVKFVLAIHNEKAREWVYHVVFSHTRHKDIWKFRDGLWRANE